MESFIVKLISVSGYYRQGGESGDCKTTNHLEVVKKNNEKSITFTQ